MIRDNIKDYLPSSPEQDLVDEVTRIRSTATEKREYDQISMKAGALYLQMKLSIDYMADKTVAFLGEGIMALLFGAFYKGGYIEKAPKHMIVLDFDEEFLARVDRFANERGFGIDIETHFYNVGCPVPADLLLRADSFYTNPPYGSKNEGLSPIIFIDRCNEITRGVGSSGCIVLPYDQHQVWARVVMHSVQTYLADMGYVVTDMIQQLHTYHLEDNPLLESATVFVDQIGSNKARYSGRRVPTEEMETLYGSPRSVPFRINSDGTDDFNWDCPA